MMRKTAFRPETQFCGNFKIKLWIFVAVSRSLSNLPGYLP
jgi:hypothetical protein